MTVTVPVSACMSTVIAIEPHLTHLRLAVLPRVIFLAQRPDPGSKVAHELHAFP